jgi:hypothetical protein
MAIIPMGDDTRTSSLAIAQRLRVHKVASVCYVEGPVKKRLKRAVGCVPPLVSPGRQIY